MPKFVGATLDVGAVRAANGATPTAASDLATKGYIDALIGTTGVATLVAGQATVSLPAVTSGSRVWLTPQDGNTYGALRAVVTAGVGFTISSSDTSDSGVVAWYVGNIPTNTSYLPLASGVLTTGSRLVLFGHSLAAYGGAIPNTRGWGNLFAGMARAKIWDQAVGGAVLGIAGLARGVAGYGGIAQILQGAVPNPTQPVNWRGAWNAGTAYGLDEGVSSGGNWYRWEANSPGTGFAAPGAAWVQVTGPGAPGSGNYSAINWLPILMYGNNDLGEVAQKNPQAFLSALETAICRLSSAAVYEETSPMITYAGGTFTPASWSTAGGSGVGGTLVPNTPGATITFTTPADFPGGYVAFGFALAGGPVTNGQGAFAFTVDGSNTNVLCSGLPSPSNIVNVGSPNRRHLYGTSLSAAIAAGVAITSLPVRALMAAVVSGDTITVGMPGSTDTFTASGAAAVGVTAIPVTSHAPVLAHANGDSVYDSTQPNNGTTQSNDIVIRVPVAAGAHTVVATVQAGTTVAGTYFDYVEILAPTPPPIIVSGLWNFINDTAYWPTAPTDADTLTWNTAIQALIAGFPPSIFLELSNTTRPGTTLTSGLTAGQTAITSLVVAPLPYAIATGDTVTINSSVLAQTVTVAAPGAAKGATAIPVASFTSTFAQSVGTNVWDNNVCQPNFYYDSVHPSIIGHQIIASVLWATFQTITLTPQQAAIYTASQGQPSIRSVVNNATGATTVTVGTGVASQFGKIANLPTLSIAADPGDEIEITMVGLWVATAAGPTGVLDIGTYDKRIAGTTTASVINWVSGVTSNSPSHGYDVVGPQVYGLVDTTSAGTSASVQDRINGKYVYPVQAADIIGGTVTFAIYGSCNNTTTRTIWTGNTGVNFSWSLLNRGPASYLGES